MWQNLHNSTHTHTHMWKTFFSGWCKHISLCHPETCPQDFWRIRYGLSKEVLLFVLKVPYNNTRITLYYLVIITQRTEYDAELLQIIISLCLLTFNFFAWNAKYCSICPFVPQLFTGFHLILPFRMFYY